jgi:hypothetical protein
MNPGTVKEIVQEKPARREGYSLRHFENLHIPLWLLKDTCWMLEWKILGVIMIVPTLSVAMLITYKTRLTREVYINLAITFWIMANAFWMCCEFFEHVEWKLYAGIPFGFGFVFTFLFYVSRRKKAHA